MIAHSPRSSHSLAVDLLRPEELDEDLISLWSSFQKQSREWENPFFHPAFTRAAAAVRDDVRVGVLRENGRTVGFFPFQQRKARGRPVAHPMSDFHDVIHEPGFRFDAADLIRQCGLRSWSFDHVPASQQSLSPHRLAAAESPCMDLERGWEEYLREQKTRSSRVLSTILRKARKIGREVGPLRLDFQATDRALFETLIEWKAKQQDETGARPVLRRPWVADLLDHIRHTRSGTFRGVLSALYAGDELLAVHLGMQNGGVLHMWIQAYSRDFYRYSPGLVMLTSLGEICEEEGITRIDLGKGPESYKRSFQSDAVPLIEGSVDLNLSRRLLNKSQFRGREWIRSSSLYPTALGAKRFFRKHAPKGLLRSRS